MGSRIHTIIAHLVKRALKNKKIEELLKTPLRLVLLIAIFVISSLLFTFYLYSENNKHVRSRGQTLRPTVQVLPVRLMIPAINTNANVQHVGVTPEGEMEVPNNTVDVGWFKLGPLPGEKGSSVISGHVDGENGEAGVFTNLYKLKVGNKLYTKDSKGVSTVFVVRESRIYDPGYAEDVFSSSDSAHLNLVTCDGVWDGSKKSYSKRLVVFTDKVN